MSFASPLVLLALLGIPLLMQWYAHEQRRRSKAAAAFVAPALTASVAPRRPRWRRHLPMLAVAIALAVVVATVAVVGGAALLRAAVPSRLREATP